MDQKRFYCCFEPLIRFKMLRDMELGLAGADKDTSFVIITKHHIDADK